MTTDVIRNLERALAAERHNRESELRQAEDRIRQLAQSLAAEVAARQQAEHTEAQIRTAYDESRSVWKALAEAAKRESADIRARMTELAKKWRSEDDTSQWGNHDKTWCAMELEEALSPTDPTKEADALEESRGRFHAQEAAEDRVAELEAGINALVGRLTEQAAEYVRGSSSWSRTVEHRGLVSALLLHCDGSFDCSARNHAADCFGLYVDEDDADD